MSLVTSHHMSHHILCHRSHHILRHTLCQITLHRSLYITGVILCHTKVNRGSKKLHWYLEILAGVAAARRCVSLDTTTIVP